MNEDYQRKFDLLMEVPAFCHSIVNQFDLMDTEYTAVIVPDGSVVWYNWNRKGSYHTFQEVFDNAPMHVKEQLIFYLEYFI